MLRILISKRGLVEHTLGIGRLETCSALPSVGMDVFFGKIFSFGVGFGYHLVADCEKRIGKETNYSTPEFSLAFGISFGG